MIPYLSTMKIFLITAFAFLAVCGFSQNCTTNSFRPVTRNNVIEWEKFPVFSLPFKVIYNGSRLGDTQSKPLRHGFSHIAFLAGNEGSTLPFNSRATLYNALATPNYGVPQPWSIRNLESPWGNDLSFYRSYWDNLSRTYANFFSDSFNSGIPKFNLLCFDIERMLDTDLEILRIKTDLRVPAQFRALPDAEFIKQYKIEIQSLYAQSVKHLKAKGLPNGTLIGSYSDVPIRGSFLNWLDMTRYTWNEWKTNPEVPLYLTRDLQTGKVGGEFYNQLDFLTPSTYYFYDYNSPLGKEYLSYLLFTIEVNRAWSDKDIIPFIWLKYHNEFNPTTPFIPAFMAEASAIFPFFSGAKGIWLWDNPIDRNDNYATYEYFINGLYRLSQHKDMFEGAYELLIPQAARDHYELRNTIWRGVVKGNQILIAAHNPYATENQTDSLLVTYKGWAKKIALKGRETALCRFDWTAPNDFFFKLSELKIFPNPVENKLQFEYLSFDNVEGVSQIIDANGRLISEEKMLTGNGKITKKIDTTNLLPGVYFLNIIADNARLTQKFYVLK